LRACDVQWAHAVNSEKLLNIAMNDDSHFLEADISFDTNRNVAVMAHGVTDINGDSLAFEAWFTKLMEYNLNKSEYIKLKHAKLDFKDNESAKYCIRYLGQLISRCNFQIWLNADVLTGPFGKSPSCNNFIEIFKSMNKEYPILNACILSLGWTTTYVPFQSYNTQMINDMKTLIEPLITDGIAITFAVRAAFIKRSLDGLMYLLGLSSNFSLTSWEGSEGTSVEELQSIIKLVGANRVYIDSRVSKLIIACLN